MVLTKHIPRKHNLMEKCEKNRIKKMINLCELILQSFVTITGPPGRFAPDFCYTRELIVTKLCKD